MIFSLLSRIPPGGEPKFHMFSLTHLIVFIVVLIAIFFILKYIPLLKGYKYEKYIRWAIAILMFSSNYNVWSYVYIHNLSWQEYLPAGTCGWAIIFGSLALVTKKRIFFVLNAFYGFGAIITFLAPSIIDGPDSFYFYEFFYRHILIFITPFYMIYVLDFRIVKKDFYTFFSITGAMYILNFIFSMMAENPEKVNRFYTVVPGLDGTPLDWFYAMGQAYYTIIWFIVAAFFGYIYGFVFHSKLFIKDID